MEKRSNTMGRRKHESPRDAVTDRRRGRGRGRRLP